MKAPKLVKTKKANSRSQSELQVGKCNFSEIPSGVHPTHTLADTSTPTHAHLCTLAHTLTHPRIPEHTHAHPCTPTNAHQHILAHALNLINHMA